MIVLLCHLCDSPSSKVIYDMRHEFANKHRNLQLVIDADKINPYNYLSKKYSYWLVIMVTYNLPT